MYPSEGPPFAPFQRWALRAETVHPSPLGILIHVTYGLWHAYRGALVLRERLPLPPRPEVASPCETCRDRPCLRGCPVAAFRPDGYRVRGCAAYLRSAAGGDCLAFGCRARRACPIGTDYRYEPAQAAFHMRGFLTVVRGLD